MDRVATLSYMDQLLLLGTLVLAVGMLCSWLAARLRLPDLAVYLVAGILLGPEVSGLAVIPANSTAEQLVLAFGAAFILFDGGAGVRLQVLRRVWITVTALATVGVLVTAAVVALASHALLSLPWPTAALAGAVVAATDPAALIPIFRQVHIRERLAQAVICESAFNDATAAALVASLLGLAAAGAETPGTAVITFVVQAGGGIATGAATGLATAFLLGHRRYGFLKGHGPVLTLVTVAGTYACADHLGASGFMAVFVAGLVVGNRGMLGLIGRAEDPNEVQGFADTLAELLRMAIFISLGTEVDFAFMASHPLGVLGCTAALMLVARPLAVLTCAAPDRFAGWSVRELGFLCWTRETGVIPGALVGLIMARGVAGAGTIAAVTYAAVLSTLLLQATTTRWVAKHLDLLE